MLKLPRFSFKKFLFSVFLTASSASFAQGLHLQCNDAKELEPQLLGYLGSLGISLHYLKVTVLPDELIVGFSWKEVNTLTINGSPYVQTGKEEVSIPTKNGLRTIKTVSKKEIASALLAEGRVTTLDLNISDGSCSLDLLKEQIGLRQNIVLWAQALEWGWPDGTPAKWNEKYWNKGTPVKKELTFAAFEDVFLNQKKYEIGCYTATKLVYVQAFLDYYRRVSPNKRKEQIVMGILWRNKDPLVNMEPSGFWEFEPDFDKSEPSTPGKLLKIQKVDEVRNFVPGDWSYFYNTDSVSYEKTGYEGSNSIYLGGNLFDDYYNDTGVNGYTFEQKLDEVFQWKNGVFSRSRHVSKIQPRANDELYKYARPPSEGGFLIPYKLVPIAIK